MKTWRVLTIGLMAISMACLSCSRAHQARTSAEIPFRKNLCKSSGLSIVRVDEDEKDHGLVWGTPDPPYFWAHSVTLSYLLQAVFQLREARFDLRTPLPAGTFDVQLPNDPDAKERDAFPVKRLSMAFQEAFGLSIRLETQDREALVLMVHGNAVPQGLVRAAPNEQHVEGTLEGGYVVKAGTIDSLCDAMERAVDLPVINETKLQGKFNYRFENSIRRAGGKDAVIGMVRNLGIEVMSAHRQFQVLAVDDIYAPKK